MTKQGKCCCKTREKELFKREEALRIREKAIIRRENFTYDFMKKVNQKEEELNIKEREIKRANIEKNHSK